MGGSNLPQAFPNYLICLGLSIRVSTVYWSYTHIQRISTLLTVPRKHLEVEGGSDTSDCTKPQLLNYAHLLQLNPWDQLMVARKLEIRKNTVPQYHIQFTTTSMHENAWHLLFKFSTKLQAHTYWCTYWWTSKCTYLYVWDCCGCICASLMCMHWATEGSMHWPRTISNVEFIQITKNG